MVNRSLKSEHELRNYEYLNEGDCSSLVLKKERNRIKDALRLGERHTG